MLLYVGIALAALILSILAVAATKPATFVVERTTVIHAPAATIAPWINDFHRWASWSPWEHLDPNMAKTFTGPDSGPGAVYEWSGNNKAGAGRMEILSATPTATDIQLDFFKPFRNSTKAAFTFKAEANGTQVTWTMTGPSAFPSKVMSVFISMDKMIGGSFADGLAKLKALAETSSGL